jgi:ribose transport system ATP-binding protein
MQRIVFEGLSKSYGGAMALDDVSLTLRAGTVHALMGENGAGKSTLIKLIAGVIPADSLRVIRDGEILPLHSAKDAYAAGFRFIHQELNIVPQVSVAENILLGHHMPTHLGLAVNWSAVRRQAKEALDALGASHIDVTELAGNLLPSERMLVKIATSLVSGSGTPELFVFDEPTAALTSTESLRLFEVIERLRARGAAILYVSHRLDEVLRLSDEVSVLRDGRHVFTKAVRDTSKDEIIVAMTGRDVKDVYPPRQSQIGTEILARLDRAATPALSGISVNVRRGEILGVSGLAEAGQTQFLELFLGLQKLTGGTAELLGKPLARDPHAAWARKIAYVPRERRADALMLDMPIRANTILPHLRDFGFAASKKGEASRTRALADQVGLKCEGIEQPVGQLSGGNQQKVVFARALCGKPDLLLLDEPTRGVDVGAKYDVYTLVRDLSAKGCTVILTSTDLPEILGMCDRILVLHEGRQAHLLEASGLTASDLLGHFYAPSTQDNAAA